MKATLALALALTGALVGCGSSNDSQPTGDGGAPPSVDAGVDSGFVDVPIDTTAITGLPAMNWQYVPIQGDLCRDGSATGIGVNINPNSKNLMIYLEGGGACFNTLTCDTNPATFGKTEFNSRFPTGADGGSSDAPGVFNRSDPANAMADWSFVYVPFCTGDIHGGSKRDVKVPGVTGTQQFVGYQNVTRDLARIVPTFPGLSKVVLTGISAGGFGAVVNYDQTAKAFGSVPVYSLDDSGPPMEDPYAASCLQQQWSSLWGFDQTILKVCGADCPDPTNYTLDAANHVAKMYPNVPFGLVEDTDDEVITLFYGFGTSNCTGFGPLSGATFTAGLLDSRMKLANHPNVGGFVFTGTAHTSIGGATLDTVTTNAPDDGGTVKLSDWIATLVNTGTVTNVGP